MFLQQPKNIESCCRESLLKDSLSAVDLLVLTSLVQLLLILKTVCNLLQDKLP
jgi:hypothetical protein